MRLMLSWAGAPEAGSKTPLAFACCGMAMTQTHPTHPKVQRSAILRTMRTLVESFDRCDEHRYLRM